MGVLSVCLVACVVAGGVGSWSHDGQLSISCCSGGCVGGGDGAGVVSLVGMVTWSACGRQTRVELLQSKIYFQKQSLHEFSFLFAVGVDLPHLHPVARMSCHRFQVPGGGGTGARGPLRPKVSNRSSSGSQLCVRTSSE